MSMYPTLNYGGVPLQARRRLQTMAARYPKRHGTPMRTSFAQIRLLLLALVLALASAGCASMPPPTGELATAQQAVTRADGADADQYAAPEIGAARSELGQAQAAMADGREDDARRLALAAAADADLAYAKSRDALVTAELNHRRSEVAELRQRLQTGDDR